MNKTLALVTSISALSLGGCATDPAIYRTQSSMKLCMDYLTLPSINVNRGARAEELGRRGENCSQYLGAASAQRQNDERFDRALRSLSPPAPQQPTTGYQQGTHTYMINGKMVTCTTTGTITNCF